MSFVHIHNHSHYSLLDGLTKIDELVRTAKESGAPAVALTDHGTMYGIIEFYKECKKQGIKLNHHEALSDARGCAMLYLKSGISVSRLYGNKI